MWLGGTTVLIDQPYPSFPDNMGHWAEVLVPLYNLLTSARWRRSHTHVDNIVFGNLQRSQLDVSPWFNPRLFLKSAQTSGKHATEFHAANACWCIPHEQGAGGNALSMLCCGVQCRRWTGCGRC